MIVTQRAYSANAKVINTTRPDAGRADPDDQLIDEPLSEIMY